MNLNLFCLIRLTMGAQELVQAARGRLDGRVWKLKSEVQENGQENGEVVSMASFDDISVMVVPLYPYICEHRQWFKTFQQEREQFMNA